MPEALTMKTFRRLVLAALPLVVVFAASETLLERLRLPWRLLGPRLFGEALLLWSVGGVAALFPAVLTLRVLARRRRSEGAQDAAPRDLGGSARAAGVLFAWMSAPVAAHAVLDRYVGLGANLRALDGPGPWVRVGAVLLVCLLLGWILSRLVLRIGARRLAVVGLGVSLAVGLFVRTEGTSTAGNQAEGTSAAGAERPNLLFLVWDTTRSDRLVPYGYDRPTTPHLASFAKDSILFEHATSTATFTFSSHLSMLTGVYPSTHGARLLSIRYDPRRAHTLTESLRRAGYRTGAFVGTDVLAGRTGLRHGFERYDDRVDPRVCDTYAWSLVHDLQSLAARLVPALRGNGSPHWIQDFQRPAPEVLADALDWIEAQDDGRPWFCFINLYDMHWPYVPEGDGLAMVSAYDGPLDGYLFRSDRWTPGTKITTRDRRHVAELYEGELVDLDEAVGGFLGALHLERGDTAVLLTSDHGEAFGEAGRWKHEDILEPQVRVPLLLRMPEPNPVGVRVSGRVSGVDVAPTLLALAGLELPEGVEGRSLLAPIPTDRVVFLEDRDHLDPADVRVALYRGPWKLVRLGLDESAPFQLFDLGADPTGVRDVSSEHPELLAELTKLFLARRTERAQADRDVGVGDHQAAEGLEALGYAGK